MKIRIRNAIGLAVILSASIIIVCMLCIDGDTLSKVFTIIGMILLISSIIISYVERGKTDNKATPLSLSDKLLLLIQAIIFSALVFVILDVQLKYVLVTLLAIAFLLSIVVLYLSRNNGFNQKDKE